MTESAMIKHLSAYRKSLPGDLLFENSITAMMLVDENRTITVVNRRFCSLFGYTQKEVVGLQTSVLTPSKKHFEEYRKYFEKTRDGSITSSELQYRKKNGGLFWVKLTGIVIPSDGKRYILWSFDDITKEVEARKEIHNRYLELDIIFNKVSTGLVYVVDSVIERVNPSFLAMVEAEKESVIGKNIHELLDFFDDFIIDDQRRLVKIQRKDDVLTVEFEVKRIGEKSTIILCQNVTQHVLEKKKLLNRARTDSLTGLLNRSAFEEDCRLMLDDPANEHISFAVFDIDNFKKVNDSYGHGIGDNVLIELADLLRGELRRSELLGRMGGEEFAVAFPVALEQSIGVCCRLLNCIRQQRFTQKQLPVTVSMGLTGTSFSRDFEDLYKEADRLLYQAKNLGKNQLTYTG